MLKIFQYDNDNGTVELSEHEILLVKEFAALMEVKRNICKEDKTGQFKLRAFREFTYIYLALDWNSPYSDYSEAERRAAAMQDSGLTEKEFNDPDFRAACRKYIALQDSILSIRLLNSARGTVDKFIDYFNNLDPEERDPLTGKPIYKVKDLMAEISNLDEVLDGLESLKKRVIKDKYDTSTIRGDAEEGFEYHGG